MKKVNRNAEQYFAPAIESIDILPEGIFCTSPGDAEDGGNEAGGNDGELGYYFLW